MRQSQTIKRRYGRAGRGRWGRGGAPASGQLALPTTDSTTKRTHPRTARANRERQIKRALDRLANCGQVELKPGAGALSLRALRGAQRGRDHRPRQRHQLLRLPNPGSGKARRLVVSLPVGFFLNDWVDALSDNEIITYLALRLMAQAFPNRHAEDGVFLTQAGRVDAFNLDRGFEAHRMLARYGLIHTTRDLRRNANGTMRDFEETGAGHVHRFRLDDTMLAQPALPRVIKSLKLFASGLDSDLAMMVDISDRMIESGQIQLP